MLKNPLILLVVLTLFMSSCSTPYGIYENSKYDDVEEPKSRTSYNTRDGMPVGEPGKCYAKCLVNNYDTFKDTLPILYWNESRRSFYRKDRVHK